MDGLILQFPQITELGKQFPLVQWVSGNDTDRMFEDLLLKDKEGNNFYT